MIYNFLFIAFLVILGDLCYFLYCEKKYSIDNNIKDIIQFLKEKESIMNISIVNVREFDNKKVVFYKKGDKKYIALFSIGSKGCLSLEKIYLVDSLSYFKVKSKRGCYVIVYGEESIYANYSIKIVSDREDFNGRIIGESNILKVYPLSKKDKLIYVEKNSELIEEGAGVVCESRVGKFCTLVKR